MSMVRSAKKVIRCEAMFCQEFSQPFHEPQFKQRQANYIVYRRTDFHNLKFCTDLYYVNFKNLE